MKVIFITAASDSHRRRTYRLASKLYGHSNSITGPLILGHLLENAGHDVEVYEELNEDLDFDKLKDADVYCLYTMTSTAKRAYFLADQLHATTGARVLIGGMHASFRPQEAAEHADQVVVGEAETVIVDVVEGRITDRIVQAPLLRDLDSVPFPDYSLLKTPCEAANVMTTRGCPFTCTFCTTTRMFHPYRRRSVDSVMAGLRYYKQLGFKYMNFEDDNFTANKPRAKEICRRMIAEGLVFRETFFFGRVDLAKDEEMVTLLEQAHLTRVLIGIESLNQAALDKINKHQKIADIEKCAQVLSRHKIRLIVSLVLGIDSDGPHDIQAGVSFAKRINAYQLQPAILTPFPGTVDYQQYCREHRMLTVDWELYDMMHVVFEPSLMTPWELEEQFLRATRNFYSFFSSFEIMKRFGVRFGLRRVGLSVVLRIGTALVEGISVFGRGTYYYRLRHLAPDHRQPSQRHLPSVVSNEAASPHRHHGAPTSGPDNSPRPISLTASRSGGRGTGH